MVTLNLQGINQDENVRGNKWSDPYVKENFGEKYVECVLAALVKLREARGVKQADLAERLGLGQPVVSRIENGESELKMPLFYNWCIALHSKPCLLYTSPSPRD